MYRSGDFIFRYEGKTKEALDYLVMTMVALFTRGVLFNTHVSCPTVQLIVNYLCLFEGGVEDWEGKVSVEIVMVVLIHIPYCIFLGKTLQTFKEHRLFFWS